MVVQPAQTTAKGKHATGGKPLTACDTCGMAFKKLEHLQRHIRTHTQDRPYPCIYPGCGKAFARQDTLNRHARLHTRDEQDGAKPRARKRTKSVSEPSVGGRSGYPSSLQQRRHSSTSSAGAPQPSPVSNSFSPPAVTVPDLSPNSSTQQQSAPSRFSTLDLLGLSFPPQQGGGAADHAHLPALCELYPDGFNQPSSSAAPASPGVGAFGSFSPMANSLFLSQSQSSYQFATRSPRLSPYQLDFDAASSAPSAASSASPVNATPSDDDAGSATSDPSSLTPESYSSTVATSFQSSPDEIKQHSAQLPPINSVSGFEVSHMTIPEHHSVSHSQPRDAHNGNGGGSYIEEDDLMSLFEPGSGKLSPMLLAPQHRQHAATHSEPTHNMPISIAQHNSSSVSAMSVPALDQGFNWNIGAYTHPQSAPTANGLGMLGMSAPSAFGTMARPQSHQHKQLHPHHTTHMDTAGLPWLSEHSSFNFDLPPYLRDA